VGFSNPDGSAIPSPKQHEKPKRHTSSIYEVHSRKHRNAILLVAALATMIVPCTDTIYLPALEALGAPIIMDQPNMLQLQQWPAGWLLVWRSTHDTCTRRKAYCAFISHGQAWLSLQCCPIV
jgi:hypothetical protein